MSRKVIAFPKSNWSKLPVKVEGQLHPQLIKVQTVDEPIYVV